MTKFGKMRKKKMGRPPKDDKDKQKNKVTLSLTDTDMENLGFYGDKTGITEFAQAARLLFLEGIRNFLSQQKKPGPGGKGKPS